MSEFSGNGHYVQCPLCEGKGRMKRSELAAKLTEAEQRQKSDSAEANRQSTGAKAVSDFESEVLKGPVTRILWRRSPKE